MSSIRQYLVNLSDDELLKEAKALKPTKVYDSIIIGLLMGISIYGTIKHGFGLLTLIPLLYFPIASSNRKSLEEVESVMKERGLD